MRDIFDVKLLKYLEGFITPERSIRFKEILQERTRYITVAMEDVFQMHNTSAVIRSCDVFGVQDLHVIENRFGERLDKNIAMGAQQWVSVHRYMDSGSCVGQLRSQGYQIIATTPHGGAQLLTDFALDQKTAFFFGTEKEGLSDYIRDVADGFLKIPMHGFSESLNISVSAAIVLHEMARQLREAPFDWHLTSKEREQLQLEWTKCSIKSIEKIMARYESQNQ
ncbi:MAG: TrmH family RNA methyltransferase [Flavobacteriaceae bacterium]